MSVRWIRWLAAAAMLGGVLWMAYGVFEMLEPWGTAKVYRENIGYELVTNAPLFVAYSLPGSLALFLTALGLLGVIAWHRLPLGRLGKGGVMLAYVATGVGVLSALGVAARFAPLFFGGLVFGSLILGAATFVTGIEAWRAGVAFRWTTALLALGMMGLFMLPLRPLVYAVKLVPEPAGAAFMGLFGLGWVAVGYRLRKRAVASSIG